LYGKLANTFGNAVANAAQLSSGLAHIFDAEIRHLAVASVENWQRQRILFMA
jgi:hypothetical protein